MSFGMRGGGGRMRHRIRSAGLDNDLARAGKTLRVFGDAGKVVEHIVKGN